MADPLIALNDFLNGILGWFFGGYEAHFVSILLFTFGIAAYSIIIWRFYKQVSKVKPFGEYDAPLWVQIGLYLFTLPLFTFLWFFMMTFFIVAMAEVEDVVFLIAISAGMVGATRIAAYIDEGLAENIANLMPFILLAIFVLSPQLLSIEAVQERLSAIPQHLGLIFRYMVFLVALEWFFAGIVGFAHMEQKRKIQEKRNTIRLAPKRSA